MELFRTSSRVKEKAHFLASTLRQLRSVAPLRVLTDIYVPLLGAGVRSNFFPAGLVMPSWFWAGNGIGLVVLIDGAATLHQCVQLVNSYGEAPQQPRLFDTTTVLNAHAREIEDELVARVALGTWRILLVGHSLGGAIASVLARRLMVRYPTAQIEVCTYGAPRAFRSVGAQAMRSVATTRWMTDEDPVPLLPFRPGDSTLTNFIVGQIVGNRWFAFRHTHGGRSISAAEWVTINDLPPTAVLSPGTSVAAWLFNQVGGANNYHALTTYVSRLVPQTSSQPLNAAVLKREAPIEPVGQAIPQGLKDERDEFVHRLFLRAASQTARPLVIPRRRLFKVERIGRVWGIYFQGVVFAFAPREDRARGLARAGNDFLRRLQIQGQVDPVSLAAQFLEYVQAATALDGGFVPPLQVQDA